ncbi:energry transducer TonB [Salmonella enterica subsp. enterica]|nr:energry transducer TonB [Salmonella enterica subsp. enterica]EDY2803483.1 energry transducer TonB [Salmonella enterica subsp. enterica]
MIGSNVLRLAPFCLLLLAGNVFADTNNASEADISNYAKVLSITIKNTGGRVFNAYKGKSCVVKKHLARDGSLLEFSTENGASDLCNKLSDVLHSIKKLPAPPSDEIYELFKNARLSFKP